MPTEDEILATLKPSVSETKRLAVAAKAREARALELEIELAEQQLKDLKAKLFALQYEELPDLMDEAQVDRLGIPAEGNYPAMDLRLRPHYQANIAAGWLEHRRQEAFDALTKLGHQDLIKTEVIIRIPREDRAQVEKLLDRLRSLGFFSPEVKESVHSKTLSAWLKEQVERGNQLPPLETIGAFIGRVVEIKERRS